MRRLAALAAIAVLSALALSGSGAPRGEDARAGEAQPPRVEGLRTCRQRIEGGSNGRGMPRMRAADLRVGPVIFFGLRAAADPGLWDDSPPRGGGDHSWKSAIAVRKGRPVVLAIAGGRESGAALIYDMREFGHEGETVAGGGGDAAVRVKPCPPRTRRFSGPGRIGRWTAFSGGFLVEPPPMCATVQVFRAGRMWSRNLKFGTGTSACP